MKFTKLLANILPAIGAKSPETEDCAVSSGSFGNVAYRYHAAGPNCAPKKQIGMIEGALYHELTRLDAEGAITGSNCVHFDPDGGWDGWVLFGHLDEVTLEEYCGPSTPRNGGKDEI